MSNDVSSILFSSLTLYRKAQTKTILIELLITDWLIDFDDLLIDFDLAV